MKSKRNQYLLLGLVVVIWAGVIYRFVSFTGVEEPAIQPIRVSSGSTTKSKEATSYRYYLNYADPFLKTAFSPPPIQETKPVNARSGHFRSAIPPVEFVGIVSSGRKKTGIIRIGGHSRMVSAGDEVMNFEIRDIEEESIQVRFVPADTTFRVYHPARLPRN